MTYNMDNEPITSEIIFRKIKPRFIVVKNIPLIFGYNDIAALLEPFQIDVFRRLNKGLHISYDIFGRSTGVCYIKTSNEADYKEIICFMK